LLDLRDMDLRLPVLSRRDCDSPERSLATLGL
jgi:hypothetical protein